MEVKYNMEVSFWKSVCSKVLISLIYEGVCASVSPPKTFWGKREILKWNISYINNLPVTAYEMLHMQQGSRLENLIQILYAIISHLGWKEISPSPSSSTIADANNLPLLKNLLTANNLMWILASETFYWSFYTQLEFLSTLNTWSSSLRT